MWNLFLFIYFHCHPIIYIPKGNYVVQLKSQVNNSFLQCFQVHNLGSKLAEGPNKPKILKIVFTFLLIIFFFLVYYLLVVLLLF